MDQIKTGKLIQTLRKEQGLTQKELAQAVGVSDKAISKWENGNGFPDVSNMLDLCRNCSCNFTDAVCADFLHLFEHEEKRKNRKIKRDICKTQIPPVCLKSVLRQTYQNCRRDTV